MFTIVYRCTWRDHWYYDGPETPDWNTAVMLCRQVGMQRGAPAVVQDEWGRTLYAPWGVQPA